MNGAINAGQPASPKSPGLIQSLAHQAASSNNSHHSLCDAIDNVLNTLGLATPLSGSANPTKEVPPAPGDLGHLAAAVDAQRSVTERLRAITERMQSLI